MATLKDVAREVGVSVATVSYVLNNTGSVSKDVKRQVIAAVERLNYRPNRQAQAMRTGLSKSIGLLLPNVSQAFYSELLCEIEREARKNGVALFVVDTDDLMKNEAEGVFILQQQSVDGILWQPCAESTGPQLSDFNKPVVIIDKVMNSGSVTVSVDYYTLGKDLAKLAESQGHCEIGFLTSKKNKAQIADKKRGFSENMSVKSRIIWELDVEDVINLSDETKATVACRDASLVICDSDILALNTINAIEESGLRCPEDVSVIGCGNEEFSAVTRPKLTTVDLPVENLASIAVQTLLHNIREPDKMASTNRLQASIVERESTSKR